MRKRTGKQPTQLRDLLGVGKLTLTGRQAKQLRDFLVNNPDLLEEAEREGAPLAIYTDKSSATVRYDHAHHYFNNWGGTPESTASEIAKDRSKRLIDRSE
jgi:hypothetical protein